MRTNSRNFLLAIAIGLFVLLGCGLPAATPANVATEPVAAAVGTQPSPPEQATPVAPALTVQPAVPERRRLTLEFPPRIRAGDSDVVRLTLEVDDLGNVTPTAEIGGNVVTGDVIEIPNVYETHNVIAEARFDIAGIDVRPADPISTPLTQGSPATFYWSVHPQEVGTYRGTISLDLRFVNKSNGEESRKAVSAQVVEIEAANLLGLSGAFARTTGLVGSIVGTVVGFPFLEDILRVVFKRRIRQNK